MVCKKRKLDVEEFQFDLPATEDSLSGKTLGQLKLNTLRLIPRGQQVVLIHVVIAIGCSHALNSVICSVDPMSEGRGRHNSTSPKVILWYIVSALVE